MTSPAGSELSYFPKPIEEAVQHVRATTWFADPYFYCNYVDEPTRNTEGRVLGNCNIYAGRVAEQLAQSGKGFTIYLAHLNNHFTVVVVDGENDVHFITADKQTLSVPRINRLERNGEPFLLTHETIEALRQPDTEAVFSWHSRPAHLMTRGVDPMSYIQHQWLRPETSPVGLVKWPVGSDYMVAHSALRKVIVGAKSAEAYPEGLCADGIAALEPLKDADLTIDTAPDNLRYKAFRKAIERLTATAETEQHLTETAQFAEGLFTAQGPVFAPNLDSPARRIELATTYGHLQERAKTLGSTALTGEYRTRKEGHLDMVSTVLDPADTSPTLHVLHHLPLGSRATTRHIRQAALPVVA